VDAVKRGTFRPDLYFRLAVLAVRLPPLREREGDIPVITEQIARHIDPGITLTPEAMEILRHHRWPGNARELRNVLTRAFVLGGPSIDAEHIAFNPLGDDGSGPPVTSTRNAIEESERQVVLDALRRSGNNRTRAARDLGVPRSTLLYKLRRWGIEE